MRILLAIDGSPRSDAAVKAVASRPWPSGSEIRIVSAYEVPISPVPETMVISAEQFDLMESAAREQAESIVEAAAAKIRSKADTSISIKTRVLPGSPRIAILDESEDWKADLIVVGSHGYGTLQRFLLGSVSHAVVSHAKCSVEVVRTPRQAVGAA